MFINQYSEFSNYKNTYYYYKWKRNKIYYLIQQHVILITLF